MNMPFDNKSFEKKWNDRLASSKIKVSALYSHLDRTLNIRFYKNPYLSCIGTTINGDSQMNFIFDYSVSKRSLKRFDNILSDLNKRGILILHSTESSDNLDTIVIQDHIKNVDFIVEESEFKIHNNEYIKRKVIFNSSLVKIIGSVTIIENVVDIISKYYEYDSDGNEICNLPYLVGDIVSLDRDRESDYLVNSIRFDTDDLEFSVSKLSSSIESEVILFGEEILVKESEIIQNRDFRINQILK